MDVVIQIEQKQGWDVMHYVGPINEEAEVHLAQILPRLSNKLIINFRQVAFINSCGVRGWINFMREVGKGREIVFEECTPETVMQINMIPSFRGSAKVKSVYASYRCENCSHQQGVLFEKDRNLPKASDDDINEQKCPKCGSGMEMEEMEDEFFAFVDAA